MFWIRELAGWALLALGVIVFGVCYFELIRHQKIFEAGPTALMGIFLFRGGIHLLKVAVAARICQRPEPERPQRPRAAVSPRLR